jgi:phosphoribosyl-ATP pyrophosphohydrolase/phosphoribosyl-AMP cyclohydrolase
MSEQTLIPAIVQDHRTGEVLMLAYMNDESLKRTKETGYTWFWSRSRQKYWKKGETSGNLQVVKEIRYDCDDDTYLVLVEQIGGKACHTDNRSCFYRQMSPEEKDVSDDPPHFEGDSFLAKLGSIIAERREKMPAGSYTAELFEGGVAKIGSKIMEEAGEVVEAAQDESDKRVVEESADVVYHLMVLLAKRGLDLSDVERELESRHA